MMDSETVTFGGTQFTVRCAEHPTGDCIELTFIAANGNRMTFTLYRGESDWKQA